MYEWYLYASYVCLKFIYMNMDMNECMNICMKPVTGETDKTGQVRWEAD